MTVENVTRVFNKIKGDKLEEVMGGLGGLGIPSSLREEIQRRYSTDTEKIHAYADYYVNYHPGASWDHLIGRLYQSQELTAARESKSFMSTGEYYTYYIPWIISISYSLSRGSMVRNR